MGITASEARTQLQSQQSPAQRNGPSQQKPRTKPANHPATAEVKTLAHAENQSDSDNYYAARRVRRQRRPRTKTGMKGRSTTTQ